MNIFLQKIKDFWIEEKAITAVEYGFIASIISLSIIAGTTTIGDWLNSVFLKIAPFIT